MLREISSPKGREGVRGIEATPNVPPGSRIFREFFI
jgi:hypothetical protein